MSARTATTPAAPRNITLQNLITWTITLGIVAIGAFGTMKVNEAIMNTKFNDFKEQTEQNNQYFDKRFEKQDVKLDLIIDGLHKIELQLKDKQDRKDQ